MTDPLTDDQLERLQRILTAAEDNESRLSGNEIKFIADQQKRLEEYGARISLSPKQWAWLTDIEERCNK